MRGRRISLWSTSSLARRLSWVELIEMINIEEIINSDYLEHIPFLQYFLERPYSFSNHGSTSTSFTNIKFGDSGSYKSFTEHPNHNNPKPVPTNFYPRPLLKTKAFLFHFVSLQPCIQIRIFQILHQAAHCLDPVTFYSH